MHMIKIEHESGVIEISNHLILWETTLILLDCNHVNCTTLPITKIKFLKIYAAVCKITRKQAWSYHSGSLNPWNTRSQAFEHLWQINRKISVEIFFSSTINYVKYLQLNPSAAPAHQCAI